MGTNAARKSQAVLHPQRLRIIRTLAAGPLTTKALAMTVHDIPQASLYRHLRTLLDAGVIEVVAERPVRGVIERHYALVTGAAMLSGEDLAGATREDHFRFFSMFATDLIGQFSRYLERDFIDLEADGVGYREAVLHLTDDEFAGLIASLRALLVPLAQNEAGGGRTPRLLATVLFPLDPTQKEVL